jgi:hypothetical protein
MRNRRIPRGEDGDPPSAQHRAGTRILSFDREMMCSFGCILLEKHVLE